MFLLLIVLLVVVFIISVPGYRYFVSSFHLRNGSVYVQQKNYSKAIAEYKIAQQVFPHNIDALAQYADLLRKTQQYLEATTAYKEWLKEEPYLLPIYTRLGYCYINLKDYNLAHDYFTEGLKLNPDNLVLLNNLANLMIVTNDYERALEYFKRATIVPHLLNDENRLNFARTLLATRNAHLARHVLFELYLEDPGDPQIMQLLAQAEYLSGKLKAARWLYRRLFLLSPDKYKDNYLKEFKRIDSLIEKVKDEKN
jgi:tetratricopeptide (TPR) repeat protein